MAPKPITPRQPYYPSLDGLRGLAILLVLFYHLFRFVPGSQYGWIGVDLFFVLSGFLISNILLAERDHTRFAGKFYMRRWLRTLPLYLVSLSIVLYVLPRLVRDPGRFQYLLEHQRWFWFQLQNWLFFLHPQDNPNILNHFWSLAVEEQFYLLVPVFFILIGPVRKLMTGCLGLLVLVEIARLLIWFARIPGHSYEMFYTFTRIDGLCVGTAISLAGHSAGEDFRSRFRLFLIGFFLAATGLICFRFLFHYPLPLKATCVFPAIAIGWGFILIKSLNGHGWFQRMLKWKALVFAGRISYGWYIIHHPLNWMMEQADWHRNAIFQTLPGMICFSLASTILSGSLAVISFYGFERPVLRLKRFFV